MDIKKIVESLKEKSFNKKQILVLFLCGVLLMIIAMPVKEEEKSTEAVPEKVTDNNTEYARYLEHRLENILSQIEGTGDVACMVTLSQSAEKVVEKDLETLDETVTESDSQGGTRTTKQSSHSENAVYNEGEKGSPYVSKEISPKVEGVLVIAEGGDNAVVVKNITEGVQALFGIESHKIRIVKKGG